jgi:Glycosyl transferase family 2
VSRDRVSVVIPTFNGAQTLPATLRSLRRQTRRPDEVIVVDDGSSDPRSRALLARLPGWVTLVSQENAGPGVARNLGIERSSGELVLPLDDDDLLAPTALEKLERALHCEAQASFAYGHVRYFGAQRGQAVVPRFNGFLELFENRLCSPAALFRRAVFAELGLRYPAAELEDWGLWLQCIAHELRAAVVEEPLLLYRRKASHGRSHASLRGFEGHVRRLRELHAALFTEESLRAIKAREAPALEVLCTRPAVEAAEAARLLAGAQGLFDVRSGRAPGSGRALLVEARGKYLCCLSPQAARALAARGPALAQAMSLLEASPPLAWVQVPVEGHPPALLVRTERLSVLIADDLPEGAPPEALVAAAQRLLPGMLAPATTGQSAFPPPSATSQSAAAPSPPTGQSATTPPSATGQSRSAASGASTGALRQRALAAASHGWKHTRALAEALLGKDRVGRALHPWKLRADALSPSVRGGLRALSERRLPNGLARLVPPSIREERAMLDRISPGVFRS